MTDVLGWRAKFGVLGPSTNTIVQPEFDAMRVPGVTNHYSRIIIENANAVSDETFIAGTMLISENTIDAVRGVLTCSPDYLVMGMSAVTFYGGAEGARKWRENIEQASGLRLSIGSESCAAAMKAYGSIERIVGDLPLLPRRQSRSHAFFRRLRLPHGARPLPALPELDRYRRSARRHLAAGRGGTRRRRCGCVRAGGHEPVHAGTRRRTRA